MASGHRCAKTPLERIDDMSTESRWPPLEPEELATLKRHIERVVEHAVEVGISEVLHRPETRKLLVDSMAEGVTQAMQSDTLWTHAVPKASAALRESAKSQAGGILFDGLKGIVRIGFFLLLGYSLAGAPGLLAAWKAVTTTGAP
jgi:hypothetical protein